MEINLKSGIYDETDYRMLTHFLFQIDALLSKWEKHDDDGLMYGLT